MIKEADPKRTGTGCFAWKRLAPKYPFYAHSEEGALCTPKQSHNKISEIVRKIDCFKLRGTSRLFHPKAGRITAMIKSWLLCDRMIPSVVSLLSMRVYRN
jgi:hypothetical protein